MPKSQRIIWTALPNGVVGNTLKLSAFVSPRLYNNTDTQLSDFPNFVNWAKLVNDVKFSVEFKGGPKLKTKVVTDKAVNDYWTAAFNSNTFVRAYKFADASQRVIRSFPVAGVMGYLKGLYTAAGQQSPTVLPHLKTGKGDEEYFGLNDLLNDLGGIRDRRNGSPFGAINATQRGFEKQFDALFGNREGGKVIPPNYTPPGMTAAQFAFTQVDFFYDRKRNKNLTDEQLHPKPTPKRLAKFQNAADKLNPKLDFHQMVAGLGDYPELERKLGLLIDLEIDAPTASLATLLASHSIRILPEWGSPPSAFNNDFAPWTKLLAGKFIAEPKPGSDLANGMLRLVNVDARFLPDSKADYDLLQLDVDGGALKTLDFAGNVRRWLAAPRAFTAPDDGGLPSFRTCGLALAKRARAFKLASALQAMVPNNQAVESSPPPVEMNLPVLLYADDLVRGYRVDIFDNTSASTAVWRSLCKRIGTYSFPGSSQSSLRIPDEGYVKGATASSTVNGASDSDLYLHETLFQWEGWSLSAPRPGKTIIAQNYDNNGNPLPKQDEKIEPSTNSAAGIPGVNIETAFVPQPGTLPRLRFGHAYRMRVRTADIAGNSLPPESKDDSQASQEHLFARFDPVVPPALVLRDRVSGGESVERMVIRSNYDQKVPDYIVQPAVTNALSGKDYKYHDANERHIAPPKTSQQMAELHGKFDDFIGFDVATSNKKDYEKGYKLALKEEGTFLDTEVYDPQTDSKKPVSGVELVTPTGLSASQTTLPLSPPGSALTPGQYVIHKEDDLLLPYLPDPFARGAAFVGLPRIAGSGPLGSESGATKVLLTSLDPIDQKQKMSLLKTQFDGTWPDAKPFRISIVEGSGAPVWKNHVLTVFLQKAEVARVRYSSYLNKEDLVQMGVWSWFADQAKLEPYAAAGQHWMLTPFRHLDLVHAVQQPLKEPKFYKMQTPKLKYGDTFAVFDGHVDIDSRSTGKIEVLAQWTEWIDPLAEDKPRPINVEGAAFELKIPAPNYKLMPDGSIAQDAKDLVDINGLNDPGTIKHEFHDTHYRKIDYHIVATTRFAEYFPVEITSDQKNISRDSDPDTSWRLHPEQKNKPKVPKSTFKVLNSARPAAPKVLYVVPTFKWYPAPSETGDRRHKWKQSSSGKLLESARLGNGLRVYLERPWYSSGDEEQLGVVLREAPKGVISLAPGIISAITGSGSGGPAPNDPLKPFVTQWGLDPIWSSALPKPSPRVEDFKLAKTSMAGLTLDELSGVTVAVAGHDVEYDEARKLWFCDIEIDTGSSYYPFVRMALARFQANSIANAHLSRVVLADFAQLAPDRTAVVTYESPNLLAVMVGGFAYRMSSIEKEMPEAVHAFTPSQTHGNPMTISLEAQMIGTDLGWVPVPNSEIPMFLTDAPGGATVWKGRMELPADRGSVKLRLVIREYEQFIGGPEAHVETRVVYADVLEL